MHLLQLSFCFSIKPFSKQSFDNHGAQSNLGFHMPLMALLVPDVSMMRFFDSQILFLLRKTNPFGFEEKWRHLKTYLWSSVE